MFLFFALLCFALLSFPFALLFFSFSFLRLFFPSCFPLFCFALLCFALLSFALLAFAFHFLAVVRLSTEIITRLKSTNFALLCFALLCFALFCSALLCSAFLSFPFHYLTVVTFSTEIITKLKSTTNHLNPLNHILQNKVKKLSYGNGLRSQVPVTKTSLMITHCYTLIITSITIKSSSFVAVMSSLKTVSSFFFFR